MARNCTYKNWRRPVDSKLEEVRIRMLEGQILRLPTGSRGAKTEPREIRANHPVLGSKNQETTSSIPGHGGVVLVVHRERKQDQAATAAITEENSGVAMERGTSMCLREAETGANKGSSTS